MTRIDFESFGVTCSVGAESEEIIERVRDRLTFVFGNLIKFRNIELVDQRFEIGAADGDFIEVRSFPSGEVQSLDREGFERFFEALVRNRVGEFAPEHVFVHAGVVEIGGKALILPGHSFSGKSTLVEALVRSGARYCSDEYAVLDSQAMVHPFPKPLSIRNNSTGPPILELTLGRDSLVADNLTLPCKMVLFTEFSAGARFEPVELSGSKGLLRLIEHVLPLRRNPGFTLKVLNKLALRAIISRSYRAEAYRVADQLIDYFNRSAD